MPVIPRGGLYYRSVVDPFRDRFGLEDDPGYCVEGFGSAACVDESKVYDVRWAVTGLSSDSENEWGSSGVAKRFDSTVYLSLRDVWVNVMGSCKLEVYVAVMRLGGRVVRYLYNCDFDFSGGEGFVRVPDFDNVLVDAGVGDDRMNVFVVVTVRTAERTHVDVHSVAHVGYIPVTIGETAV